MWICKLTDDQLNQALIFKHKLLLDNGVSVRFPELIQELIDRRAEAKSCGRLLEQKLAFEFASSILDGMCSPVPEQTEEWVELFLSPDLPAAARAVTDAVEYFEVRNLLVRHPANDKWVRVRKETEARHADL